MAEEAASTGRRGVFVTALRRPDAAAAAIVLGLIVGAAIFAPLIAPQNPFDLSSLDVLDSNLPPAWLDLSLIHI